MPRLSQISPLIPVTDMTAARGFFADVLGFDCLSEMEGYAYMVRDGVAVRLVTAAPDTDMTDEARQIACYIDVTEVDALYAELAPALSQLPPGHVRPPFDQTYGQREFHVIYAQLLLFFGAPIPDTTRKSLT